MTHLLDTSVLIAYFHNSSPAATAYITQAATGQIVASVSSITSYEIWRGAQSSIQRTQAVNLFKVLSVLSITDEIALLAAEIYQKLPKSILNDPKVKPIFDLDIIIAATAEHHRLNLVTINRKHYSLFSLQHAQVIYV